MRKKTRLTIEIERVLIIRRGGAGRRAACAACGEGARLLTVDEAAALARVSARAVYRLAEAGKIHFTETGAGSLLICFNSLCRSLLQADGQGFTINLHREGENHER